MITLCSLDELKQAKETIDSFKEDYPSFFEKIIHVVNLTRALQFKYQYMGCLLMDEDPGKAAPDFIQESILRLYQRELQEIKNHLQFEKLKQIFMIYRDIEYTKIFQLIQSHSPESLTGSSTIR
ncbi:MAG TPA: hypothetical protein VEY51_07725 [Chondromyces sp.]|nr:hypothetical protein [Chondromyces sp.]